MAALHNGAGGCYANDTCTFVAHRILGQGRTHSLILTALGTMPLVYLHWLEQFLRAYDRIGDTMQ
jgi:hypothetical protein